MSLAAPLWLLFLLPWAIVALWLLRGYRPTALVPFLHLWPDEPPPAEKRRRYRLPSWPIILLLLAALLAILSASRPGLSIAGRVQPPLIVVDRGITQLAGDRYTAMVHQTAGLLESSCLSEAVADVRFVPGPALRIAVRDLSREMLARPAWPLSTRADLLAAIEQARRDVAAPGSPPILVLSDQPIPPMPGTVRAPSGRAVSNVGIESIAATDEPSPQVMLRLRNDSPQSTAEVTLTSAGRTISKTVKLPPPGESADVFIDLPTLKSGASSTVAGDAIPHSSPLGEAGRGWVDAPALGETIEARLTAQDDLLADNVAHLVREFHAIRPVARTVLPPALSRMIEVHIRLHARSAPATDVDISTAPLAPAVSGIVLASTSGQATDLRSLAHADHPLLRNVTLPRDATIVADPPGDGWTVLASLNSTPLLATREKPSRQIWVGFWSGSWSSQADFVIFWTNAFNWLGGGQSRFISEPTHALPAGWERISPTTAPVGPAGVWPGLYRRGTLMAAINSPAPADLAASATTRPAEAAPWQDTLREKLSPHPARRELTSWLLLAALLLILSAAMGQSMRHSHADLPVGEPDIRD